MHRWISISLSVAFLCNMTGLAQATHVRFILVGDSTVAEHSGWGSRFCADVTSGVTCLNLARGGRSSKSYRADGTWAQVMDNLRRNNQYSLTYVLIQFGHNDQPGKPGRSTDVTTEFPANMKAYLEEVKATGARPLLVTPLSRRQWDENGKIHDTLDPWANADKAVAREEQVSLLDLHTDSIAALEAMGQGEGDTLAMAPRLDKDAPVATTKAEVDGEAAARFDGTHLGAKGAVFFARMVEAELTAAVPDLKASFSPVAK
jgi:lysophospholipase L1-like esterase